MSLQPLINLDFFERLVKQYKPDLATFHSNHVAHYQHRHWRAMDPTPFLEKPSQQEIRRFAGAIEYGYRVADEAIRRIWKLADDNTVVIVAYEMGQQPYVNEAFPDGRSIVRVRDINQMLDLCGGTGHCRPISMMAPQWNLQFTDPAKLDKSRAFLAKGMGRYARNQALRGQRGRFDTRCQHPAKNDAKARSPGDFTFPKPSKPSNSAIYALSRTQRRRKATTIKWDVVGARSRHPQRRCRQSMYNPRSGANDPPSHGNTAAVAYERPIAGRNADSSSSARGEGLEPAESAALPIGT